jgi:hypothetical protein
MSNDEMWDPRPRIVPPGAAPHEEAPPSSGDLVMVELSGTAVRSEVDALRAARELAEEGFELDEESSVVPMGGGGSYIVHGRLRDQAAWDRVASDPAVVRVWRSTPIAPF